jgi:hypothetical protein
MPAGMTKPLATLLSNVGATESGPTASNQAGGFCRGREGSDNRYIWQHQLSRPGPNGQPRESSQLGGTQFIVISPLLVATIQRLPQRTMESTRPTPGIVSPTDTFRMPPGPFKTAVPPKTSRTVQPGMVFGLVSGVGVSRGRNFFSAGSTGAAATFSEVVFCCTIGETGDETAG